MAAGHIKTPSLSRAYSVLAALFAMNLLNYIDRFILAAVINDIQETPGFTGDDSQAGLMATIFFVSYAIFSPVVGWLGDRMSRRYLLALGVGVWSLATFGSGLATSDGQMLLARSVLGIGEAAYATLAPTLIADLFVREQRNRALAIFYVAIPLGAALGYVIGGQIVAHHEHLRILPLIEDALGALTGHQFTAAEGRGWRMAFFVVGLPGLLVALAALFIPEPHRGATEAVAEKDILRHEALPISWRVYASLFRNCSYLYNCLAMAMLTFALGGLQFWTPKFLSTGAGALSRENANLGLGVVVVISGLVGTPLGAWLGDWLARRYKGAYFWMSGLTMLAATPFILAALLAALFAAPQLLVFGCILIGLTLALLNYGPSNAIIINVTIPKIRAAAFAVNILIIHVLGDIPSPYVMGAVSDWVRADSSADAQKLGLFWGLVITVPAMVASGVFFCLGARYLESDQEAVLKELRSHDA
jgi:MFS family permease